MAITGNKVQGLDKLKRKFNELPEAMQAEIIKASEAGAEEMVGMAKRLVPVDRGDLRDSIGWTHGAAPEGSFAVGKKASGASGDQITIYAGSKKAYYARWVEFGVIGHPAQPFFFPSYRALKKKMTSANKRAMSKAAKKVAAGGV